MKRIWLLSIVLLAVAAVEFGALGAASAGASFVPGWLTASKDGQPARRDDPTPRSTPVSPPQCRPDREHGNDRACDGQPASIQLTPDPLVIQCDGFDRSTLTVRITDANGHPVADGTYVSFWAYNGNTTPSFARTERGIATTSVVLYGDIFRPGPNLNVGVGPLEAGIRIRCFPVSNPQPPSPPPCSPSPPSPSPPCPTPTPAPLCSPSPPSLSPPCPTPTPTPQPCWPSPPSASPPCGTGEIGSATLVVGAPDAPQAGGTPFQVTIDLTEFTPGTSATWAGYDLEMAYDTTVLQANSVAPGLCPASAWANIYLTPHIVSGCAFQASTATGTLETITFTCLTSGSSPLWLLPRGAPDSLFLGTGLFDVGATDFAMTLIDASVTCEPPLTPSPLTTATPTPTPTQGISVCISLPPSPACDPPSPTPTPTCSPSTCGLLPIGILLTPSLTASATPVE